MTAEFTPAQVRHMFFEREKERCFVCRKPLQFHERGFGWSVHHRRGRGMGGSREVMTYPHGLVLCGSGVTGCHGRVERNREVAYRVGLLIPRNATTEEYAPASVRVRRLDGSWWLLTESGRAIEVEEGMPQ